MRDASTNVGLPIVKIVRGYQRHACVGVLTLWKLGILDRTLLVACFPTIQSHGLILDAVFYRNGKVLRQQRGVDAADSLVGIS
jgi:hypothetical protein